jgi:hypothetical protein
MKAKRDITKSKVLMMLSTMIALTKTYKKINESCVFALSSEKSRASKIELKSATTKTLNFFKNLPVKEINGNPLTLLNFCDKAIDILIEKTSGDSRIRSFEVIKQAIASQLIEVNQDEQDDSHRLITELG